MKTILTTITFSIAAMCGVAQNARYTAAMEALIKMTDTAATGITYVGASNAFERIANAEKKEWLPFYYAAYTQVQAGFMGAVVKDNIDDVCNRAENLINKADSLSPNNSEIYTVKGYLNQLRIQVNPMMRGSKYGPIAGSFFQKAMELDPNNPRPYHLNGIGLIYRPAMFGGGKDKACPEFQKAQERFEKAKPSSIIAPRWGVYYNKKMMTDNCK